MMNLADPELELVDPTPNVHTLFIHFDKEFFWTKLASRAVVRWSKRMYSCAGICSYEGRGGLCDIALSEPLLKLRPRKDLVETLLHEMIHAFLFVTNRDQDRDGHGPNFKSHMYRINQAAGLNISIYHDFHDEVKLYQTHWWRCNGPCQTRRPHFGIVRKPTNTAPSTRDYWWNDHLRKCGGTFIKIKEPENFKPRKTGKTSDNTKKTTKPNGDITKYINNTIKTINDITNSNSSAKPVLKDSNINKANIKTKTNSSSTVVVSNKGNGAIPSLTKPQPIPLFTGNGYTINATKPLPDFKNVTEHVRNIWANKEIPTAINKATTKPVKSLVKESAKTASTSNLNKHKATTNDLKPPPAKIKKIDDYFNATTALKDLYGDEFVLKKPSNGTKLVAVTVKQELVDCPICNSKIDSKEINRHLDECLNKDVIEKLSEDKIVPEAKPSHCNIDSKKIVNDIKPIPEFKAKQESTNNNVVDLTNLNHFFDFDTFCDDNVNKEKGRRKTDSQATLKSVNINRLTSLTSETNHTNDQKPIKKIRKSDNFITKDRGDKTIIKIEKDDEKQNEPMVKVKTDMVKIKSEPGTSKDSKAFDQVCPCCGKKFEKSVEEHLDECLVFFDNNSTIPEEGASTSFNNSTIVIDDDDVDDIFDESQLFNETGTKFPCPCCMKMVEQAAMNEHLDSCLGH